MLRDERSDTINSILQKRKKYCTEWNEALSNFGLASGITTTTMKNLLLIFALAFFWGLSGLLVGLGIRAFLGGEWMIQWLALNIIAGMLMLLFITRDKGARKAFYAGVAGG